MRKVSIHYVLLLILLAGCGGQKKEDVITIKTKYGNMVAILYDETPKHKANFIKLAKEHYFDSLLFHRVIEGFMIQGGDPDSKHAPKGTGLGNGGPAYTIEAEINPKFIHEKGALAAARLGDDINPKKASSGSQFFIVQGTQISELALRLDAVKFNNAMKIMMQNPANKPLQDSLTMIYQTQGLEAYTNKMVELIPRVEKATGQHVLKDEIDNNLLPYAKVGGLPNLDGAYTIFGKVIQGLEVIDKIAAQPHDQADRPDEDIRMKVTTQEMSRKEIEEKYGYRYDD